MLLLGQNQHLGDEHQSVLFSYSSLTDFSVSFSWSQAEEEVSHAHQQQQLWERVIASRQDFITDEIYSSGSAAFFITVKSKRLSAGRKK